jgi:hypothetical protein
MNLQEKIASNTWDNVQDFIRVLQMSRDGRWVWFRNTQCKYVNLRVDMRTGACLIMDRDGKRIDPSDLEYQYSVPGKSEEPK